MNEGYRVFIPTAGIGSRIKKYSNELNKSLLEVNNKPIISHIINKFPKKISFVIALGFKGNLVKNYLELAHPEKKFYFVNINKFKGRGSGLGLTLLKSKKYLNLPFIFISCDTIFEDKVKIPDHNWVGVSGPITSGDYRAIQSNKNNIVVNFIDKKTKKKKNLKTYIGLAGIHDHKEFWSQMRQGKKKSIKQGEFYGLKHINKKIKSYNFKWNDTGNENSYKKTLLFYKKKNSNINILPKKNENIWFNNNIVVKYFNDHEIIQKRVRRAKYLKGFVPKILNKKKNMYSYKKVDGNIMSEIKSVNIFKRLLEHISVFHQSRAQVNSSKFLNTCKEFYKTKTIKRVKDFHKKFKVKDTDNFINGKKTPKLRELLSRIDWKNLYDAKISRFHGDLHFENILYSNKNKNFYFLDWRQDFGNSSFKGDIYYDLAKFLHGLIVSHESVSKNKFFIHKNKKNINLAIKNPKIYSKYQNIYYKWLKNNNFDIKKVNILTGLIFLNIAPLHHHPYSIFLYFLGKKILLKELTFKN